MSNNTDPIYSRAADVQQSGALHSTPGTILGPTAVTAIDGTGALQQVFVADATNDGWIDNIILKPIGSPAGTVARLFFCSATGAFTPGTTNTAANTTLIDEVTLAAITSSNTNAQAITMFNLRQRLPVGTRLLIGFGTSTGATGVGYVTTAFGGKF